MEMKSWIICFVLVAVAILVANSELVKDESDRGFLGQRKFSSNPPKESEEVLGIPDSTDNEDQDVDLEMDDEDDDANQKPAGILIRDTDLKGGGGILVIQNGPPSALPLMFELRPVMEDSTGPFIEVDDGVVSEESNEAEDVIVPNNRFKPADTDWEDDEEDDGYQEMTPPKRRIRPTVKPKRRQSPQVSNFDRDSTRPSKKTQRPVSQPIQKKRKRNPNRPQNQNKNKNKNKNKIRNQKRKPNNKRKRLPNRPKRRKNSGNLDVFTHQMNNAVDRRKHLGVNMNKGSGSNTITRTVTTTQTGSADDEPNVNYIVINRPTVAPTTERPFWDILGRSADSNEADRSFNPRRAFKRRALG